MLDRNNIARMNGDPPLPFKKTVLNDETGFMKWAGGEDPKDYDLRGFYANEKEMGTLKASLSDYHKDDPDFHFYSIGQKGKILKSPTHPTRGLTMMYEYLLGNKVRLKEGEGLYSVFK